MFHVHLPRVDGPWPPRGLPGGAEEARPISDPIARAVRWEHRLVPAGATKRHPDDPLPPPPPPPPPEVVRKRRRRSPPSESPKSSSDGANAAGSGGGAAGRDGGLGDGGGGGSASPEGVAAPRPARGDDGGDAAGDDYERAIQVDAFAPLLVELAREHDARLAALEARRPNESNMAQRVRSFSLHD